MDVRLRVVRLQEQHLGDHQVGDLVVDLTAQEDDAVAEQTGIDVVGALAAMVLLDDDGDERHGLLSAGLGSPVTNGGYSNGARGLACSPITPRVPAEATFS